MHMLGHSRFSSHENLIRAWGFHRLDDLCASKELDLELGISLGNYLLQA